MPRERGNTLGNLGNRHPVDALIPPIPGEEIVSGPTASKLQLKQLNVRIPEELHKRLHEKLKQQPRDVSLANMVAAMLVAQLEEK